MDRFIQWHTSVLVLASFVGCATQPQLDTTSLKTRGITMYDCGLAQIEKQADVAWAIFGSLRFGAPRTK